jgi:hypothetical protein
MTDTPIALNTGRLLNDYETMILSRLLQCEFEGRDSIASQLRSARARPIDDSGSIEIMANLGPAADVATRVPVEAQCLDVDGVPISIMLFVANGFINELEFSKADGSAIKKMPDPEALDVFAR